MKRVRLATALAILVVLATMVIAAAAPAPPATPTPLSVLITRLAHGEATSAVLSGEPGNLTLRVVESGHVYTAPVLAELSANVLQAAEAMIQRQQSGGKP